MLWYALGVVASAYSVLYSVAVTKIFYGMLPVRKRAVFIVPAISLILTIIMMLGFGRAWLPFAAVLILIILFASIYDCGVKLKLMAFVTSYIFMVTVDIILHPIMVNIVDASHVTDYSHRTSFILISMPFGGMLLVIFAIAKKYAVKPVVAFINRHFRGVYIASIALFISLSGFNISINLLFYRNYAFSFFTPLILLVFSLLLLYYMNYLKTEGEKKHMEALNQYHQKLEQLYHDTRAFRHNRKNMLIALSGYLESGNYDGLHKYVADVVADSGRENEYAAVDGISSLHDDGLKSLFIFKYLECLRRGISFELFADTEFAFDVRAGVLIELLGILLDNAIEAAGECPQGSVTVKLEAAQGCAIEVVNSFQTPPDTRRIFDVGYTTKPGHSGFGLYRMKQILRKHRKISYSVECSGGFFILRLAM